jgi:hypothetical protein
MAHPILPLHLSQHPIYCLVKAAPPPCPDQLDYASYTSVLTHIPVSLLWQSKSRQVQQILVNVTSSTPPHGAVSARYIVEPPPSFHVANYRAAWQYP